MTRRMPPMSWQATQSEMQLVDLVVMLRRSFGDVWGEKPIRTVVVNPKYP